MVYKSNDTSMSCFILVEIELIHSYFCGMLAMKSMSICNDLVNYDEILIG